MNIPDYIEPFVAYRTWQWGDTGLMSLNNTVWPVGAPLVAHNDRCVNRHAFLVTPRHIKQVIQHQHKFLLYDVAEISPPAHEAPAENCSCGVYAAKNFDHLKKIGYVGEEHDYGVHGECYLWGRIWDHELGYRAQYAYPKNLIFTFNAMPWSLAAIKARLELLTRYNVEMFLQITSDERELLWSKETGFNPRAFECEAFAQIIQDRKKWYTFKEKKRPMEPGAVIALLGLGIGIIQQVDEVKAEVYVLMFNRQTHKIPAICIGFDHQNWRWESTTSGVITSMKVRG